MEQQQQSSKKKDSFQYEDCILCYDECRILGIGKCNHKPLCYKCVYKMRLLNSSKICPICNSKNDEIIMTTKLDTNFENYDLSSLKLYDEKMGIYSASKECSNEMKKLSEIKCFVNNCKQADKVFQTQAIFKKHLKDIHSRLLCDICLQNKKCLLHEQTLYTRNQLNRHLKHGDIDDQGYVYFFHPYCTFCDKSFYDEEQITVHMTNHFQCHICQENPENKFVYYKDYQSLEKHYRMSHYLCEQDFCLEQCFIVFKTAQELEMHNIKVHKIKTGQEALQAMVGFKYDDKEGRKSNKPFFKDGGQIKDKEGIDFESQFLTQQKSKMQVSIVDDHADDIFDFRDLYCLKFDEEDGGIDENDIINSTLFTESYRNIGKKPLSKQQIIDKLRKKDSKQIYLEDLRFSKQNNFIRIKDYEFSNQLESILSKSDINLFQDDKNDFYKKSLNPEDFFFNFLDLCGNLTGYKLFPLFIRSINNENLQNTLDKIYLQNIQKLPKKQINLVNSIECYSEFFSTFLKEIEENILQRIESKRLSLKKRIKMEKARIFQLIEILRRLKTPEMTKLKYLSNFGLSIEGIDYILKKVYFAKFDKIQEKMSKIPTQDLLKLYIYIQTCKDLISGQLSKVTKRQVSSLVLKKFFDKYPDVVKNYCMKYRTHISDASSDEEKEQKSHQFSQFQKKAFEAKQKHDFPDLVTYTKEELEKKQMEENQRDLEDKLKEDEEEKLFKQKEQSKLQQIEKKYVEAKKKKKWEKNTQESSTQNEEQLEYRVNYKKKQEVKERRVILDSDEEKQIKKQKDLDIEKKSLHIHKKESQQQQQQQKQQREQQEESKENNLITYDNSGESDSSDEETKLDDGNQWGAQNNAAKKMKIQYEQSNIAQKIKNETKSEDHFPTLGGGAPSIPKEENLFDKMKQVQNPSKSKKKQGTSYKNPIQTITTSSKSKSSSKRNYEEGIVLQNKYSSEEEDNDFDDMPVLKSKTMSAQQPKQKQKQKQVQVQDAEEDYPDLLSTSNATKQASENDIFKKRQKKPLKTYQNNNSTVQKEKPTIQNIQQAAEEQGMQAYQKKKIDDDDIMFGGGNKKKGKKQKYTGGFY